MFAQRENLTLRRATPADAPLLGGWWRDGEVMAHAGFPLGLTVADEAIAQSLAGDSDDTRRRLILCVGDRPVGEMSYENLGGGTAEIGIKICDASMQGKGLGPRFLRMLMDALFVQRGYEKIVLDTNLNNVRAQRVYERLGFERLGERRDCWQDQLGRMQSAVDYAMTRAQYDERARHAPSS